MANFLDIKNGEMNSFFRTGQQSEIVMFHQIRGKKSLFILGILAFLIAVSVWFGVPFIRQSQLHEKLSNPLMQAAIIDAAKNSSSAVEHNTAAPVVLKEIPANLATLKAKQILVKPWAICIKSTYVEDIICENRAYPNGENWIIYQPLADGRNLFYNEQ